MTDDYCCRHPYPRTCSYDRYQTLNLPKTGHLLNSIIRRYLEGENGHLLAKYPLFVSRGRRAELLIASLTKTCNPLPYQQLALKTMDCGSFFLSCRLDQIAKYRLVRKQHPIDKAQTHLDYWFFCLTTQFPQTKANQPQHMEWKIIAPAHSPFVRYEHKWLYSLYLSNATKKWIDIVWKQLRTSQTQKRWGVE